MARNNLAIYDEHAADWWTARSPFIRGLHALVPVRMRFFDPVVGSWAGKDVLDLGCGGGLMSVPLARRGARVTAVDPSRASLEAGAAHAREQGLAIQWHHGTGESLDIPDASMDAVVCVDVLEHVKDLPAVIRQVRRVLRPGGVFLFDTINRTPAAWFILVVLAEYVLRTSPRGTHDPALFIRPAELRAHLAAHGFTPPTLQGLSPVGLDLNGRPVFARIPVHQVMYLGYAHAPTSN